MEQPAGNKITGNPSSHPALSVKWVEDFPDIPLNRNEAYKLRVTSKGVEIEAITETGVYRAIQTLRQLTEKKGNGIAITGCEITDWPAFRIRGFMQDVGRTYISTDELKREIAILARYKINVFHWHLTENQAWRLQSKVFPMLNDSVNTTRQPGKYYTLEEARELAAFCKQHHVLLIPEIDMPGHSAAFVRTFRHDMQSPEGMKILKLLIDEVCETFDVPYLHIGTDEVQFTHPNFVPEMVAYVRSKGKKVISWNPGWHYKPGEIDMTHLWSYRGKAQKGIPAIDSRFHYLNHFDTFADLFALYNSRIYNELQGSDDLAGTILAIWNDRISSRKPISSNRIISTRICSPWPNVRGEGVELNISTSKERFYHRKTASRSSLSLISRTACSGIRNIVSGDIRSLTSNKRTSSGVLRTHSRTKAT